MWKLIGGLENWSFTTEGDVRSEDVSLEHKWKDVHGLKLIYL